MSKYKIVPTSKLRERAPVVDFFDTRESATIALKMIDADRFTATDPATVEDLADEAFPWALVAVQ